MQADDGVRDVSLDRVRAEVDIFLNSSKPSSVRQLLDHNGPQCASLGISLENNVVVYIGRIAIEKNVRALIDAVEHLDESWHAVIIGPQYLPLERIDPRGHLLPAQQRIGNWLGIADVLRHASDYESHCFSINEAWLAGIPVASRDYLVNRLFDERHGRLMWLVPVRPELATLAAAIDAAFAGRNVARVAHARDAATQEYSAPTMGRRWSDLIGTLTRTS